MGIVLLLAALAASALAGPTGQRQTCALHCNEANYFSYHTGKSYVYEYSVTTSTALLGTFEDDARMHITANAHIDVTAPCEYTLRLTKVSLDGSSHAEEFAAALTKSPLRFSFQDGRVESLCSEVSEPAWVLNIKRGVLSTFQNSMTQQVKEDVQETDISGVCVTHYKRLMEGNVMTVEKVKDLSSCTERPQLAAYIAATPYDTSSPVNSLPIFKSTNKCSQTIEEGVLKTAECEETHKYRPFSSEEGGAVTTAKTTLSLVSHDRPVVPIPEYQFISKSLVFEQTSASKTEVQVEAVEKILNDLTEAAHDDIRPEVPALFSNLVASLKTLDYPMLNTIYTNTHDRHSQKFLIDAIPLVGTAASIGIIKSMLLNGDMTEADVDVWFTSLAFFKNPTSDMFTAIAPLLENNPSKEAMLGTSAMVKTFCKINPECTTDQGVRQILRRIETHLGFGCRFTNEEEKMKILVALKALGNAGHWVNANTILRQCYADDNDMEIRVAAIEAWRHTPCEYDRSNLLAAFQDETQDPEVRIAAYLAVMTCPTPTFIDTIKDRLTSEGVNQVGSFIWTHMTNMQESAAPGKQWAREVIGEELLQKKFSTDALKFSRNYESSFFMKELNAGAAVESNVIFSSKSYLPRSAMLNLTLDLFGESINLFEVGGRIEGFEAYIERFFGPNGYFPEETVEAILRNMRRDKRDDDDATTLEGFFDNVSDEPQGSYYLRVFGNELYYNHFQGLEELMRTSGNSNPLEVLMDLLRKGDVDYTKSYQLIDTQYSIPTVSGLPVTLTAKGTATVSLKMNGNFVAENLRKFNIEGRIQPSAAVQMDGLMIVDAHVTRTGLKLSSTLHTSTFLDGKVQIEGCKLVDIAFNTPKDKIEVIDVKTEFFYLEDDQEIKQEAETMVKYEGCTRGTSGLAICSELNYTPSSLNSPIFPFSGPSAAHVYFKKTDTQSAYILRFNCEENRIAFLFDTPQSQANHRISFAVQRAEQEITFDLHTPFKSLQGNGGYTWQKNDKHITLDLTIDEHDKYKLEAGTKTSGNDLIKSESFLILTSPAGDIIDVKGTLQANARDAKYVADIVVSNYPIAVHASYDGEEGSANVNVMMNLLTFKINANGQLGYDENSVTSKAEVEFGTMGGNTQRIQHSALIRKYMSEDINTYLVKFELNPTYLADRALTINFRSKVSVDRVESKCTITNGPVTWNLEQLLSYNNNNNLRDFNATLAIDCPQHGIDFLTTHDFKIGNNYLTGGSQVRLNPGKDYLLKIELSGHDGNEAIGRIDTQIEDIKATAEVILSRIANDHYTAKVIGNMFNREKYTLILEGALKNTSGKFTVVAEGSFKSQTNEITFSSGIYADEERANVALRSNVNSQKFFIIMEGTRNSILVDANVYRHITINSYIGKSGDAHKLVASVEWDKDVDPTKLFAVNGLLSPSGVGASFKYGEKEISASGKILDNGVEMEAMWTPDRRVIASVHYSLGDTKSLAASVETPFPGWEKQDATFTVSLKDYEITSRAAVTWKNTEQMSLTINGKLQPGLLNNALNTEILFSSNFESFQRISFTLNHNMAETTINTNVHGQWNDSEMKGTFHLTPNENGVDSRATFTSPFTEEIIVSLHHQFVDTALSTSLEAKYGAEISTITLIGQLETGQVQTSTLELKVRTPTTTVPDIDGNIKYTYDGNHLVFVAIGKAGEKKIMFNVTGEKTTTESSTVVTGDLRFITPFTSPVTVTLAHSYDGQQFTTQFEVTGAWFTSGTVKMHAKGHMVSMNDIEFSAVMSNPTTKASFSLIHKFENNAMFSTVDATANGERISAYVKGYLDVSNILVNVKGEVASTYSGMDDVRVKIESAKDGNTRTSRVILVKGTNSMNIQHIISYDDILNWENSFEVNGNYKLRNKQTHVGTPYVHVLEYKWGSESVSVEGTVDPKISEESRKIDAQVIVTTPWENYENIKIDFHHQDDGLEYKPTLRIEYKLGVIEIATRIRSLASSFYIESNLTTPFWQSIEYKLNIDFHIRKAVALTFTHGADETAINVNGNLDEGKMDGYLEIHSTYLTVPVLVEASYDIISPEKKVHLSLSLDKRYEFTGSFSGHMENAKWFLITELPTESANHIEFSGEYDVTTKPYIISTVLKLNSQNFEVTGKIDTNEFLINMDINGKKGSLSGNWFFQYTQASFTANFQSPLNESDNLTAQVMYDFENDKKAYVKLVHGTQEFNLIGMLESEILLFEATTPFSGWEKLGTSFFISNSAIKAVLFKNDQKIEINGTINIKPGEGKIGLIITTPYTNFETISLEAVHIFQDELRTIEFKSTFGREVLSLQSVISLTHPDAPELILDIITPFEVMKTAGGHAKWNLRDAVKTAEIEAYQNDLHYNWKLETAAESSLKGYASCKISTPLSGWTDVSVKGSFDFNAVPYGVVFLYDKEGVTKRFEGHLSISEKAITGEIVTPFTGWERIYLNGLYSFDNNHLSGYTEFTKGSEKYEAGGEILFDNHTPKFYMKIKTPVTYINNIELRLEANMANINKSFSITFIKNDIVYSAAFTGQFYGSGFLEIITRSSIPGYTSLEISAEYDFTSDMKRFDMNMKKEGEDHKFSIAAKTDVNNILINVITPFEGYESLRMNGDYRVNDHQHGVTASFLKNGHTYNFHADVTLATSSVTFKLSTPIAAIKNVVLMSTYEVSSQGIEASVHFERNGEVFKFNTRANFTPMESRLYVAIDTPIVGFSKLVLNIMYNFISEEKVAHISVQKDAFFKKIGIKASYNLENGSFQIETPIEGFQVLGAEYNLSVEKFNNKVDATVKITHNSKEWLFSAHGQYGADNIIVSFQTPFEEFDKIAINGNVDYGEMNGKGIIQCGSKKFFVNVSYAVDNMFFELATPFEILKFVHASVTSKWNAYEGNGKLTFVYNENKYMINGVFNFSARTSEITFQATTPIENFQNVSMRIKYDIDSRDEIVSSHMTIGDTTYHFVVGGFIEAERAFFKWDLVSPFNSWINVKFTASADFTQENKIFEILLEKDENVKAITISGKLVGSSLDFNFKSPIRGLQNFQMTSSFNRAKRALQFQMMSDDAEASLLTSFNSLTMRLKTPFERAEEITWDIKKLNETSYIGEWRRNDNYITISIDTARRRPAFHMKIKSELQGWEYLALTGKFDQDTLDAYASGEINEDKISIDISGRHALRSHFIIKITTPYDDYRNIEGNLSYSIRYKSINMHLHSLSSRFQFRLNFTNEEWFTSELLVPHPQEDTKMNAFISPYSGFMTITSRFEALRNFHEEYSVEFTNGMEVKYTVTLNDIDVFTLEHMNNRGDKMFHLEIHIRGSDFHKTLHIHREGFTKFTFALKCEDIVNGATIRKLFKIEMTGTENLPIHGTAKFLIRNTFRLPPSVTRVNIEVDRRSDQKTMKIDIIPRPRSLYSLKIDYNLNLEDPTHGDFVIGITTPDMIYEPWKSISGSWNVENQEAHEVTLTIGETTYRAQGKLRLYESTIILTNEESGESIFLQWRLSNDGDNIDYFLKIGPTSGYGMVKLKGTIADLSHAEIEGGFKAGPFQEHEFLFKSKFNERRDGNLVITGSFTYGGYRGEYKLVHRLTGKPAMIRLVAQSNIPDYENISATGTYDIDGKLVFNAEIKIDGRESNINVNFADPNLLQAHYTAQYNVPIFGDYAEFQLTLAYDFLNYAGKFITAVVQIGESESHVKVNWKESEQYDTFEGTIDIKEMFGNVLIQANYDVLDIDNAHAEVNYSRTDIEESLNVKWTNKKGSNHFEGEIAVQSTIEGVPNARIYSNVDFADDFQLNFGIEWDDKNITASFSMHTKSVSFEIATPFENFESIKGKVQYILRRKSKTVKLKYERGTRKINFEASLNKKQRNKGNFTIKLSTPFEGSEEISVNGNWEAKNVRVKVMRNGQPYTFQGTVDILLEKSEFDLSLQTPEHETIRIAASYDVNGFLTGTGTDEQRIASIRLELLDHLINFNVHGLRNDEKMYIDIKGETSFDQAEKVHLRLGSEISAQLLNITFELTLNKFILMIRNSFERYENGYYFKTEVNSSTIPLPALVFGLGRKDSERIVTLGYGEDRELTFSIKGKEDFRSGFSGFIDIPRYGYDEVEYDVDYRFLSDDELQVAVDIKLEENEKVEAILVYDSEGVKARLTSLFTGDHSIRVRRSVSSDSFFTEVGFDDYNLKLRGGFKDEDTKRGAIIEGDIFGKKFLIDFLFQSEGIRYSEGKLIIQTPFQGMEEMGGLFTWVNEDQKVIARAEALLPFTETSRVFGEINLDMNKKVYGFMTINVAGTPFTLKSNLVGSSLSQGYQGTVELYTPFHRLSRVYMNGNIRMDALSFLEADLEIVEPSNTHEMQLKYEIRPEKVTAGATLHSSGLYEVESTFTLEGLGAAGKKAELTINNEKLVVEYIIRESIFEFKLDSLIMSVERQLYAEAKYPSLENMEASILIINTADEKHRIIGNLNRVSNRVQGRIELESTLTGGSQMLIFDISVPNAYNKHMIFDVALTTSETHSFYFELDARNGLNTTVKMDTPIFPKIAVKFELTPASARLLMETPTGTHMAYVTWRGTFRMPANWLANVELISPLLTETYNLGVVLKGNNEKRMAKAQLRVGNVIHAIEASSSMTTNEAVLILNIETPFKNINEAKFEAFVGFRDNVKIQLKAILAEKINSFNFVFDKKEKTIVSVVESPFIPNGQAVAEATLTGDMKRLMKLQMSLKNGEKAFSGILNIKIASPEDIKIRLRVAIPHLGYKMNSLAQYTKDDITSILLYMDAPFYFKVNVNFSNADDAVKGQLSIETSIEDLQRIQAELDIPLYEFAPRASLALPNHEYGFAADYSRHGASSQTSVHFSVDEDSYGGNLSLRTRAPYEIAYGYHLADAMGSKFHLRVDSSFVSALV